MAGAALCDALGDEHLGLALGPAAVLERLRQLRVRLRTISGRLQREPLQARLGIGGAVAAKLAVGKSVKVEVAGRRPTRAIVEQRRDAGVFEIQFRLRRMRDVHPVERTRDASRVAHRGRSRRCRRSARD